MKTDNKSEHYGFESRIGNGYNMKVVTWTFIIWLFFVPAELLSAEPTTISTIEEFLLEEAQLPRVVPKLRRIPSTFRRIPNGGWKAPINMIRKSSMTNFVGDDILRAVLKDSSGVSHNYNGSYGVKPITFNTIDISNYSPIRNSNNLIQLHSQPNIIIPNYLAFPTYHSPNMFRVINVDILSPYRSTVKNFQIDSTILDMKSKKDVLNIDIDFLNLDYTVGEW